MTSAPVEPPDREADWNRRTEKMAKLASRVAELESMFAHERFMRDIYQKRCLDLERMMRR